MEIQVLKYFLTVAREGNISRAAEALHITQPTISKQIMKLEEDLGVQLFIRGNRQMILTEDGLFLKKRAEEIIDLTERTLADLHDEDNDIHGEVYIGGGETDAIRIIGKTAKALQNEYPNIRYHLQSGNADEITEKLDSGILDFGILIEPVNLEKYDFIKLPAKDTWGLLMRKECELAEKDSIHPKDIVDSPLLVSRQSMVSNEIAGWIGEDFEKLNIIATYNLIYNASIMVDEGFGCALCLDKLINTAGDSNLCFRPLEPKLEANLVLVWRKHQVFSKATEKFLKKLQDTLR